MLKPIAFPYVDWGSFIDLSIKAMGYSPTRGLDNNGIRLDDPAAFVACLDMANEPLEALRNPNPHVYQHMHMTCAGIIENDLVTKLIGLLTCQMLVHPSIVKGCKYLIITATLDAWISAINRGCDADQDDDIRKLMSELLLILMRTTFREVFSETSKQLLPDGTYDLD